MKLHIFSALTLLLATGCVLDQDLGKNDQGATGTGAANSGGAAGSGTGGASSGGTGGTGTGGTGTGGTGTGGAGTGGTGTGGTGTGGTGTGGAGTGGTGTGGTGTGGTGTGGTGGGGTGYDTVGVTWKPSAVHVVGNDVMWSTTGENDPPGTAIGLLLREPKSNTFKSGSPIPQGTQVGYIHGSGRTFVVDGSSVFAWYTQIDLGWKGAGVTKLTLPSGPEEDFVDAKGPGIAAYVVGGDNMVATDATYLYFPCDQYFFDGGICRFPKSGGTDLELTANTSPESITSMVVTGGYVYWTRSGGSAYPGQLLRAPASNTAASPEAVADVPAYPRSLVESGGDLYVLGREDDSTLKVMRFAGAAGPGQILATGTGNAGSLAVDGTHAYFGNATDQTISSVALSGGTPKVVVDLSKSQFSLGDFDVDDQNVFFLALGTGNLADLVQRAPK